MSNPTTPASKATRVQEIKDAAAASNAAPVEEAAKAKVTRKRTTPAKATPAKATTKKVTAKDKANGRTTTKATPAKATAAKAADKPKADPKPATSSAPQGHPGHTWLKHLTDAGLSQTQAATAMEVAPMTLNRLINGKGIPTANVTIRFAGAVNQPVKVLWDEVAAWELKVAQEEFKAPKSA